LVIAGIFAVLGFYGYGFLKQAEKAITTGWSRTLVDARLSAGAFGVNLFSTVPIDEYCDFIETEAIREKPATKRRYTWR
jgi:hypothetical protein